MDTKLLLHPSASIVSSDNGKVYLKMPDGEGVTFDPSPFPILPLLKMLSSESHSVNSLLAMEQFSQFGQNVSKFISMLKERQFLVIESDFSAGDDLSQLFDYISRRTVRPSDYSAKDYINQRVNVLGEGFVAEICRKVAVDMGREATNEDSNVLSVVCSDYDDFDHFGKVNQYIVDNNKQAMFVWKSGAYLNLGPLVIPQLTPCFYCFQKRVESNLHFIDEFEDMLKAGVETAKGIVDRTGALTGLIEYLITRHLSFVLNDVTSLVASGDIYKFNIITAKLKQHPVLKLPRCGVCGQAREDALTRSVRDLL